MPKSELRERAQKHVRFQKFFLLQVINAHLEKHAITVNNARRNGNWIDWIYNHKFEKWEKA